MAKNSYLDKVNPARSLGNKLAKVGGVLIVADIAMSGEVKLSHAINAGMIGASTTGVGAIIAGAWFVLDFGTMGVNYMISGDVKGFGDMIDEWSGASIQMYDGIY